MLLYVAIADIQQSASAGITRLLKHAKSRKGRRLLLQVIVAERVAQVWRMLIFVPRTNRHSVLLKPLETNTKSRSQPRIGLVYQHVKGRIVHQDVRRVGLSRPKIPAPS